MEMTTPVFSTAGQGQGGKMEFPMEEKMGEDPQALPIPDNARVDRLKQEAATVAVGTFGGFPLDFQVSAIFLALESELATLYTVNIWHFGKSTSEYLVGSEMIMGSPELVLAVW